MREMGSELHWTTLEITLPVGISFYTFQTLSYTIDVYRREIPETHSALDFALFVAFFPQLVAGPIVRAIDFLPQLERPVRIGLNQTAFFLILRGMTKKVLIADNIANLVDRIFQSPEAFPSIVIWIGAICFAIQIYCDFSGYSDIAIGISRGLGFQLPDNFNHPYTARNPSDFWERWHISLSSWLRDYLYISMGGNRGTNRRPYFNLMMTMLLRTLGLHPRIHPRRSSLLPEESPESVEFPSRPELDLHNALRRGDAVLCTDGLDLVSRGGFC
jgi:D-alanyl-lipoteichoic acid acyltransferase DltB (MBOAT superfamily)